jgi:WD40 repeat protein
MVCHGHVCGVYELAVDPRTGFLASASEDYSVFLWNLEKRDVIFLVGEDGPIVKGHVAFAASAPRLAVGEIEAHETVNSVLVIDLDKGKEVFREKLKPDDGVCALAISGDGTKLIYGTAVWDLRGDAVLHRRDLVHLREDWRKIFQETYFCQLLFRAAEQQLVASVMLLGYDGGSAVYLIDAASGIVEHTYSAKDHLAIALSPTENLVVCTHDGGQVDLLRLPTFQLEKRLAKDERARRGLCSVAFSPDGKTVVVGDSDGRLTVFAR